MNFEPLIRSITSKGSIERSIKFYVFEEEITDIQISYFYANLVAVNNNKDRPVPMLLVHLIGLYAFYPAAYGAMINRRLKMENTSIIFIEQLLYSYIRENPSLNRYEDSNKQEFLSKMFNSSTFIAYEAYYTKLSLYSIIYLGCFIAKDYTEANWLIAPGNRWRTFCASIEIPHEEYERSFFEGKERTPLEVISEGKAMRSDFMFNICDFLHYLCLGEISENDATTKGLSNQIRMVFSYSRMTKLRTMFETLTIPEVSKYIEYRSPLVYTEMSKFLIAYTKAQENPYFPFSRSLLFLHNDIKHLEMNNFPLLSKIIGDLINLQNSETKFITKTSGQSLIQKKIGSANDIAQELNKILQDEETLDNMIAKYKSIHAVQNQADKDRIASLEKVLLEKEIAEKKQRKKEKKRLEALRREQAEERQRQKDDMTLEAIRALMKEFADFKNTPKPE